MVFSSPWFVVFMCAVLIALAIPMSLRAKKNVLAVASCVFYAAWDYRYLGLLLAISVVDFLCARQIAHAKAGGASGRFWLVASVVSNLGVLAYFKYTNFFLENLQGLFSTLGVRVPHLNILLPAGISFYTFKTMSYVIDVYRGRLKPVTSWLDYATFITFFPELVAGPIVRATVLIPQLERPLGPTMERLAQGGSLFLVGFTKKICADRLGIMVSTVFAEPSNFDTRTLWAAALGYSLQIYCDFSGYSDMAIGTAKTIGYDLPENFRMPYLSPNIGEFWRRWHMTLSFWLRDYLYIPLGGNRKGRARTYVNLAATMVLGGLWHGASWNFVLWGALHGGALAAHRFAKEAFGEKRIFLPSPLAEVVTFLFVVVCWIPFRCTSFGSTWAMLRGLAGMGAGHNTWISIHLAVIALVIAAGHLFGVLLERSREPLPLARTLFDRLLAWFGITRMHDEHAGLYPRFSVSSLPAASLVLTWALLAYLFAVTATSPFIYFQF